MRTSGRGDQPLKKFVRCGDSKCSYKIQRPRSMITCRHHQNRSTAYKACCAAIVFVVSVYQHFCYEAPASGYHGDITGIS